MAKPLKKFDVTARMVLMVQHTIKAESFEDALLQSQAMHETDFVDFKGDFMDGTMAITGVSREGSWNTEQKEFDGK